MTSCSGTNTIDPTAHVSSLADLEVSLRGNRILIGPGAMIDSFVKMKFAGGRGDIVIGSRCYLNSGTVIYSGHGVKLGKAVLVASNCTLAATNHAHADPDTLILEQGFMPGRGGIVVEDDVWIGANSVLLDGARIGRGAVIGAGSIVRSEVAAYSIVAGNPLAVIGWRRSARA